MALSSELVGQLFTAANLIIYNMAIIRLLNFGLRGVSLKEALSEKSGVPAAVAGAPAPAMEASYSRVTGFVGAIVMGVFFWALGNIILFNGISQAAGIKTMLDGLLSFFLSGAALFLPYAFNQLSSVFKAP